MMFILVDVIAVPGYFFHRISIEFFEISELFPLLKNALFERALRPFSGKALYSTLLQKCYFSR